MDDLKKYNPRYAPDMVTDDQNNTCFDLNLQLFADDKMDWRKIYETRPPEDADEDEKKDFVPQPIFRMPQDGDDPDGPEPDETDDDDDDVFDPIFMPRLNVTDKNLPHCAAGEMVVADEDGSLSAVAVDDDGVLTQTAIMIDGDMIADGSISGSKLEEGTITSREIDMEDLFADSLVLSELVAQNLDMDGLFENEDFIDKFDQQVAQTAVLKEGDTMTGDLLFAKSEEDEFRGVGGAVADDDRWRIGGGKTDENTGYIEIATAKDANGPVYIRQYASADEEPFGIAERTATLLDAEGNTNFPGEVTAAAFNGNATSASKLESAHTVGIGGKVTGTATVFDGTEDITINATAVDATTLNGKANADFATAAQGAKADAALPATAAAADSAKLNGQPASYYATATASDGKVSKVGDTMTGLLSLSGDPTSAMHAATKQYVDSKTASSGSSVTTRTVTLPTYSSWSSNQYTVSAPEVTPASTVWVSPDANSFINYCQYRIRCVAQGNGTLTFRFDNYPYSATTVIIGILN